MSAALRVAVVGAGPAGAYAAERLVERPGVEVELFERLPTPWGLVRAGVAPDHPETKDVTQAFQWTASDRAVRMHLNVEVGRDVSAEDLAAHHHAVIYTVGAPTDRRLGIPGEDLPGSHASTALVAWYNGHPGARDLGIDLSGTRAVVVGNGNVALDVARILTLPVEVLRRTDIADHALDVLGDSAVEEVVVLGRRGAAQAAFTTPELLALSHLPGVDVRVDAEPSELDDGSRATTPGRPPDYAVGLKLDLLRALSVREPTGAPRRIVLRFLASPVELVGDTAVERLRIARNELVQDEDGRVGAQPTDRIDELEAGLVLRSIGYRGEALPGVPFDPTAGRIPNDRGAVVDPATGKTVPGLFTAGWIKRGPTGVIGTNKVCARETVDRLLADHAAGRLPAPRGGRRELDELLRRQVPEALGLDHWRRLDEHERRTGAPQGRPRVKVTEVDEMLRVAHAPESAASR
nr:FAD-dependent oxidoreductase [Patulibacter minatonensis]